MSSQDLHRLLGIREGDLVALRRAPETLAQRLRPLPEGAEVRTSLRGNRALQVVMVFAASVRNLEQVRGTERRLTDTGSLWLAYPSAGKPELSAEVVSAFMDSEGWLAQQTITLDHRWDAIRFARPSTPAPS